MAGAVLWLHAIGGAVVVLACISLALAAAALLGEEEGGEEFARRVLPGLNWLASAGAVVLLITGIGNLIAAGAVRHYRFSTTFRAVLATKLILFVLIAGGLWGLWRVAAGVRRGGAAFPKRALRRTVMLAGACALMGAIALALGLWLVGS
ncbi:MAG TPA: hypothetical protein VKV28_14295 [Candidatus Binataceae bacterium]|nr:hypothetical protein [Candidatus Binataceae bacterium]